MHNTKKSSSQYVNIESYKDNSINSYIDIQKYVTERAKIEIDIDIPTILNEILPKYNIKIPIKSQNIKDKLYTTSFAKHAEMLEHEEVFNHIQKYIDICTNANINSISSVTANKCIIDPSGNPISDITNIKIDVSEINDSMLNELNKNPTDLYQLSSRRFEEFIAEILIRKGYNVELTPTTRDGGKDIYAARKDDLGSFLYIVECKKYKPTHKVGVNVLRDLYGVLSKERATYGVAVTTSYFSKPAQDFQQELKFQMSLQDFDSLKRWLCDVTHNSNIT